MRLPHLVIGFVASFGKLCGAATISPSDIFITQVADPGDVYQARFVQVHALSANEGDIIGGDDLYLKLSSNSNNYFNSQVKISGETFGPDGFFIVCNSGFTTSFPSDTCDLQSSSTVNANGNDAYGLALGSGTGSGNDGTIIDLFGSMGDSSNFFQDSQAERNVAGPSASFDISEWTIDAADVADITPRSWTLVDDETPAPTESSAPTPSPLACTPIQDVQGDGSVSPYVNQVVKVCAYLTQVTPIGFYLQEVPTKASSYSSGIFIYSSSHSFAPSDEGLNVEVTGEVSEYYGMTQIGADEVSIGSLANQIFTPVELILPNDNFEQFESMIVSVGSVDTCGDVVISEYYNFDRYGEVKVCAQPCGISERPFQFTELNKRNITEYSAHEQFIDARCIYIEDGVSSQNPDPALLGGVFEVNQDWNFRGGDIINKLVGPFRYSFGKWQITPDSEADLELVDSPIPRISPSVYSSEVTMAFMNLLNYWTTVGTNSDLRGADSAEEFERQSSKTILAMKMLDVDFFAVCEVENVLEASQDIVNKLNSVSSRQYSAASFAVDSTPGVVGGDVIKVDIFYDDNKFNLLGVATLSDDSVDPDILSESTTGNIFDGSSRVPLAATFASRESGNTITIVPNHFKSKGSYSGSPAGGDADVNDGSAHYNLMRTLSSKALIKWLATKPTGVFDKNVVLCGDLNAYALEDPILELKKKYYSVIDFSTTPPPYTYVYDGQLGTLDYIFVKKTSRRTLFLEDASIWHVNTDEPDIIDYNLDYGRNELIFNATSPYRYSDHDPVIASFSFGCGDSSSWFSKREKRDCDWVAKKPAKRCSVADQYTLEKADSACPKACGKCRVCKNNAKWEDNKGRDCARWTKIFQKIQWCSKKAKKNCPKACEQC